MDRRVAAKQKGTRYAQYVHPVIEYIKAQQEHHRTDSFLNEFKRLLTEAGITFNSKYLE